MDGLQLTWWKSSVDRLLSLNATHAGNDQLNSSRASVGRVWGDVLTRCECLEFQVVAGDKGVLSGEIFV